MLVILGNLNINSAALTYVYNDGDYPLQITGCIDPKNGSELTLVVDSINRSLTQQQFVVAQSVGVLCDPPEFQFIKVRRQYHISLG
jgi:hypothetical protein